MATASSRSNAEGATLGLPMQGPAGPTHACLCSRGWPLLLYEEGQSVEEKLRISHSLLWLAMC